MINITMDNSCFDTGDSDTQDILEELFKLKGKGKIEIFREKYSYAEKMNYKGERKITICRRDF